MTTASDVRRELELEYKLWAEQSSPPGLYNIRSRFIPRRPKKKRAVKKWRKKCPKLVITFQLPEVYPILVNGSFLDELTQEEL